jgi:hypothetical protein
MIHRGRVSDPPRGLVVIGPLVKVRFLLDPIEAEARKERGELLPEAVVGNVMIDTGATGTHVFDSIPRHFSLTPIRYVPVIGENRRPEDRPVYRLALVLQMEGREKRIAEATFTTDMIGAPGTFELPGYPEPVIGLLGRDFLAHFHFYYHGPSGEYELVHPEPETQKEVDTAREYSKKKRKRKQARKARKKSRRR